MGGSSESRIGRRFMDTTSADRQPLPQFAASYEKAQKELHEVLIENPAAAALTYPFRKDTDRGIEEVTFPPAGVERDMSEVYGPQWREILDMTVGGVIAQDPNIQFAEGSRNTIGKVVVDLVAMGSERNSAHAATVLSAPLTEYVISSGILERSDTPGITASQARKLVLHCVRFGTNEIRSRLDTQQSAQSSSLTGSTSSWTA